MRRRGRRREEWRWVRCTEVIFQVPASLLRRAFTFAYAGAAIVLALHILGAPTECMRGARSAIVGAAHAQGAFFSERAIVSVVVNGGAIHPFQVEIAKTAEERARGLMFREQLNSDAGMLFDFQHERPVFFWMKNTFLPLDIIFARADGTIVRIAANATPFSEEMIPSGEPVRFVLEVVAGTASRLDIRPGHQLRGGPIP